MTMHAEHDQGYEAVGEPTIIVEEELLEASGEPRATRAQILILQQETTDTKEQMICTTALESPNRSVREVALAVCAQLWEARRARLRARRNLNLEKLDKLELHSGGNFARDPDDESDSDGPSEEELRVGDLTGVLEILADTPIGPRRARGTLPENPIASAALVEFPCPLCHRPIIGELDLGVLRIPRHRIVVPVFPYGFAMPAHLVRCPASWAPLTEQCNMQHGGSPCGDPQCWRLPAEEPRPFSEDTSGDRQVGSRAPLGYPSYPPGSGGAGEVCEVASGIDGLGEDGGELDATIIDGTQVPTDGWQPEPTMTGAEAFPDVEVPATADTAGEP